MKRFVDTNRWRDPWFRRLSGQAKLLCDFLNENCDAVGLIHVDFPLVSQDCRIPIKEQHLTELGDRVEALGAGRYFLPGFIHFQYGELSADCPPHRTILKLVDTHKLTRSGILYHYPKPSLPLSLPTAHCTRQDKTSTGDLEGELFEPTVQEQVLAYLNEKTGRSFRPTAVNLSFIDQRLKEPGVTVEGVRTMIDRQIRRWKGSDQAEYLRPETLFNRTKFDAYYAAKDLPLVEAPSGGNGHAIPLWQQVNSAQALLDGVNRELRAISNPSPTVFPERAAEAESKRRPLRERRAQLTEQIEVLRAKMAEGNP